jgi:hypothetical protein
VRAAAGKRIIENNQLILLLVIFEGFFLIGLAQKVN